MRYEAHIVNATESIPGPYEGTIQFDSPSDSLALNYASRYTDALHSGGTSTLTVYRVEETRTEIS
jgi:hypothetical protein